MVTTLVLTLTLILEAPNLWIIEIRKVSGTVIFFLLGELRGPGVVGLALSIGCKMSTCIVKYLAVPMPGKSYCNFWAFLGWVGSPQMD